MIRSGKGLFFEENEQDNYPPWTTENLFLLLLLLQIPLRIKEAGI